MSDHSSGVAPPVGRRDGSGVFTFVCSRCGETAATLAAVPGASPVDGGPMPDGSRLTLRPEPHPSYRLDFLFVATGRADPSLWHLIGEADEVDAMALRRLDAELGAFCCPECAAVYCPRCWSTHQTFDDGFYDATYGRCPVGHAHKLDD